MADWQDSYWTFFNAAGRFVGGCLFVGGFVVFLWSLTQGEIIGIVMSAIVSVLGILVVFAKPSRPNKSNDHKTDLILGGNQFGFQPQFGRLDASRGHVLMNIGNKNFQSVAGDQSGIRIEGEVRDIVEVPGKEIKYILILLNNEAPALFRINKPR